MSDAEKRWRDGYGCSCHLCAPCSFCMVLTEDEIDIMGTDGYVGLEKYWKEQNDKVVLFWWD